MLSQTSEVQVGYTDDGACYGTQKYAALRATAQVLIRGSHGEVLATAGLGGGEVIGEAAQTGRCRFLFTVTSIKTADYYTFDVGPLTHTFSMPELSSGALVWRVT